MVDDDEAETTKILLLDLALALMPALDTSNAEFLYKAAIPFVGDAAGGVQKRAYKLLQLMSQAHTGMMQDKLGHVQEAMVAALPGLQPGAAKWRLRCIAKLVEHLPFDVAYMQLVGAILGEVILGTKSAARKTREVSFAVLVTVAQKVDAGSKGESWASSSPCCSPGWQGRRRAWSARRCIRCRGWCTSTPIVSASWRRRCSRA